jgi:hypothetical protein
MRHGRPGGIYGARGVVAPPNFTEIDNLSIVSLMFFETSYVTVPPNSLVLT